MSLNPQDQDLSERISRPGKIPNSKLRKLGVERLSRTLKAVARRSLRKGGFVYGIYCEDCQEWISSNSELRLFWHCRGCDSEFRVEMVVYEKVDDDHKREMLPMPTNGA